MNDYFTCPVITIIEQNKLMLQVKYDWYHAKECNNHEV